MAQEIQKARPIGLKAFNQFITGASTQQYLQEVLSDKKGAFVNNVVALVANNATLQVCEPSSIMFCALKATALDLPLDANLGFCYVIPYKDNKRGLTTATFQIGTAGLVQLALRSGQIKKLNVRDVREGEIVGEDFITGDMQFKKIEKRREEAPIVGYVSYLELTNGFNKMLYMTSEELEAHAKRFSQTYKYGSGVWATMKSSMCEKTLLKRILNKYAPLSTDLQMALQADQAVVTKNGYEYVDNPQNEVQQEQVKKASSIFSDAIGGVQDVEQVDDNDLPKDI